MKIERVRHMMAVTLRRYLEQRKLSTRQFGKLAGVSYKCVQFVLNEVNATSIENAAKIAAVLQIPLWQLFVWGRANSDASPAKLDKVMHAYLSGPKDVRAAMERVAERA